MKLQQQEFKFRHQVLDDRDYKEMEWKILRYENPWRFGGTSRLSAEGLLSLADWDLSRFIITFQRGTYASSGLSLQFLWISNGLLPHGLLYLALTHPASWVHFPPKCHQVSGFTEDLSRLWEKSHRIQYTWLSGFAPVLLLHNRILASVAFPTTSSMEEPGLQADLVGRKAEQASATEDRNLFLPIQRFCVSPAFSLHEEK